jgi:PilZ domain
LEFLFHERIVDGELDQERRRHKRFDVRCQVVFFPQSSDKPTVCLTQNMSSHGFYCASPSAFRSGEYLTCLIDIPGPGDLSGRTPFTLQCLVQVVRVQDIGDGSFGIACKIEDYRTHLRKNDLSRRARAGLTTV